MVTVTVTLTLLEYTSSLQEFAALKQSVSACTDRPGQKQHWHGNEGRRGCERDRSSTQRDDDTDREKWARELMHNGLLWARPQDTG